MPRSNSVSWSFAVLDNTTVTRVLPVRTGRLGEVPPIPAPPPQVVVRISAAAARRLDMMRKLRRADFEWEEERAGFIDSSIQWVEAKSGVSEMKRADLTGAGSAFQVPRCS